MIAPLIIYKGWFQYSQISRSYVKNDNWTRILEQYDRFPDVDLGELKVPEPPLFHQAECDPLELSLDSTSNTEHEIPENNASKSNAASVETTSPVSLVGTWNGTYTRTDTPTHTHILTSILIMEQNADGAFNGYAIDANETFTVTGTLHGNKIDFTKSACIWGRQCTGILDTEAETVVGRWDVAPEAAPASVIEGETPSNRSAENMDGSSCEGQPSTAHVSPCDIGIAVENLTPCQETREEEWRNGNGKRDNDRVSQVGSGPTEPFGTFSLVRRPPLDYSFYTPFDIGFQESRPKALWKKVRDAAEQWYYSRHLAWDELRHRKNQRNRYVELYLKQERDGEFWDPNDGREWVMIICRTHPRDLRLWGAIAKYRQRCMIQLSYVYNLNARLLLMADSCTDYLGCSIATIA